MVELDSKSNKGVPLSDGRRKAEIDMIYPYGKLIQEFIKRTQENLAVINDLADDQSQGRRVNEVTQLINSLYGVAVLPYEFFAERSNDKKKKPKNAFGCALLTPEGIKGEPETGKIWNIIKKAKHRSTYEGEDSAEEIASKDKPDETATKEAKGSVVCSFLYHMRNALAHSGNGTVLFWSENEGDPIQSVLFYDERKRKGREKRERYCIELDIPTLCELKDHIAALYIKLEKKRQEEMDDSTENGSSARYTNFVLKRKQRFMENKEEE